MDSLSHLASDIVLCDEIRYVKMTSGFRGYDYYEATFTVVQTLKGSFRPKEQLTVEMDMIYTRRLTRSRGAPGENSPAIPMGRSLLFLTKDQKVLRPVIGGVKLLVDGEVYCYGQFLDNPGPLWLERMAPENIEVPADRPYDEESLLKDVQAAQEKAQGLTEPVWGLPGVNVIRKDYRLR